MMTKMRDVFVERRDIVVTIPRSKLEEIEAEEADVKRRESSGEKGISFYWEMGRTPKECPRRIYFVWDGAVRAYHDVISMEPGRLWLKTEIHEIEPVPYGSFRGFRYFEER